MSKYYFFYLFYLFFWSFCFSSLHFDCYPNKWNGYFFGANNRLPSCHSSLFVFDFGVHTHTHIKFPLVTFFREIYAIAFNSCQSCSTFVFVVNLNIEIGHNEKLHALLLLHPIVVISHLDNK